ncbi:hypothetical protein EXIGLDRAFT_273595 [Exidia glandulosa HHB12029]|uniref:F-box domain-containing protein n=1 Tax=Exidia glandulosa HHB12029 TaxID=1314781 RepID=A0A165M6V4_EXIGL|nr:hypothetical protein EXIGLDRAFT_273595 [Exidia glandulosa HHB12029]
MILRLRRSRSSNLDEQALAARLPNEITQLILVEVQQTGSRQDLARALRTCKAWYAFVGMLYARVQLDLGALIKFHHSVGARLAERVGELYLPPLYCLRDPYTLPSGLEELSIEVHSPRRRDVRVWKWLAFCLAERCARHGIRLEVLVVRGVPFSGQTKCFYAVNRPTPERMLYETVDRIGRKGLQLKSSLKNMLRIVSPSL